MATTTAFSGTTQKCRACDKTVHLVEQLAADGRLYHRPCFRCQHCKGTLKLGNYSSIDGVLYCKPHYDQLFKMTGSLDKSFEGSMKPTKVDRSNGHENQATKRISNLFVGTQDKCVVCKKTVYPIEKVAIDGNSYHRPCFKCAHGGCTIRLSNYITHDGKLYCKHHHSQLFKTKGDFSQLEEKRAEVAEISLSEENGNGTEKLVPDEIVGDVMELSGITEQSKISTEQQSGEIIHSNLVM